MGVSENVMGRNRSYTNHIGKNNTRNSALINSFDPTTKHIITTINSDQEKVTVPKLLKQFGESSPFNQLLNSRDEIVNREKQKHNFNIDTSSLANSKVSRNL
jgi:hypothetical protein